MLVSWMDLWSHIWSVWQLLFSLISFPSTFNFIYCVLLPPLIQGAVQIIQKERILGNAKGKLHKKYSFFKSRLCQTNVAAFFGNNCIYNRLSGQEKLYGSNRSWLQVLHNLTWRRHKDYAVKKLPHDGKIKKSSVNCCSRKTNSNCKCSEEELSGYSEIQFACPSKWKLKPSRLWECSHRCC